MDRSLAGRPGIGRPSTSHGRRSHSSPGGRGRVRPAHRSYIGPDRDRLWRALSSWARLPAAFFALLSRRRRLRISLLVLLLAGPPLAGGWLWLRHSSLVSVEHVQVTGVHGPDAGAIDAALIGAARHMSTLDVHVGALRAAVAPFRVVRDVQASSSLPHGLHIRVIEQPPVAALAVGAARTAVAADGAVLGPALLSSSLPTVTAGSEPATGAHVHGASLSAALTVLGASPAPFAKLLLRAFTGPKGLTVTMSGGLSVYFGDGSRPHAKWLSLARVLSDPSSAGASYVDVRLPERPAAGFAAGTRPQSTVAQGASASSSEHATTTESGPAALAAGLVAAGGGSAGQEASTTGSAASQTTSTSASETSSTAAPETPAATETPAAAGSETSQSTPTPGG
jgi:cell division protein FtsQ